MEAIIAQKNVSDNINKYLNVFDTSTSSIDIQSLLSKAQNKSFNTYVLDVEKEYSKENHDSLMSCAKSVLKNWEKEQSETTNKLLANYLKEKNADNPEVFKDLLNNQIQAIRKERALKENNRINFAKGWGKLSLKTQELISFLRNQKKEISDVSDNKFIYQYIGTKKELGVESHLNNNGTYIALYQMVKAELIDVKELDNKTFSFTLVDNWEDKISKLSELPTSIGLPPSLNQALQKNNERRKVARNEYKENHPEAYRQPGKTAKAPVDDDKQKNKIKDKIFTILTNNTFSLSTENLDVAKTVFTNIVSNSVAVCANKKVKDFYEKTGAWLVKNPDKEEWIIRFENPKKNKTLVKQPTIER